MILPQNVFLIVVIVFICFIGLTALIMICLDYYSFRIKNKSEVNTQNQLLLQEQEKNEYL